MSRRIKFSVIAILLAGGVIAIFKSPARSQSSNTFLRALVSGPAINGVTPFGEVEYWRWTQYGATRKAAESELRKLDLPNGTVLTVKVNSSPVAHATVMGTYAQFKVMSDGGTVIA